MRALGFALWVCVGVAFGSDASAQAQSAASSDRAAVLHPRSSIPTLEAVAGAPLACGGAAPWTEDKAIAQTGRAHRVGGKLTVGGMSFTDRTARNGREPMLYLYVGVFGMSGLDLVQIQRRDSSSYLLLDTTHRSSVELARFPVPSPSGRYLAVAAPPQGETLGGIEIVERTVSGVRSVASIQRDDLIDDPCRLTNVTWLGDDRFVVRTGRPAGQKTSVSITYALSNGQWRPGR